jgi:hypothetical protein
LPQYREIALAAVKTDRLALFDVPQHLQREIQKAFYNEKEKSNESINRLKQMAGIN